MSLRNVVTEYQVQSEAIRSCLMIEAFESLRNVVTEYQVQSEAIRSCLMIEAFEAIRYGRRRK